MCTKNGSTNHNQVPVYVGKGKGVMNANLIKPIIAGLMTGSLMACGGSGGGGSSAPVGGGASGAPIAVATSPVATAGKYTSVVVDGSASYDNEGDTLTYKWSQVSGPALNFSDTTAVSPTVVMPGRSGSVVLSLVVNDGVNDSVPATVSITVANAGDSVPVASAGLAQTVNGGEVVELNGAASSDADGDKLLYRWRQTSGVPVTIQNPNAVSPSYVAPLAGGTQVFELIVNDGDADSLPASVTVTTLPYTGVANSVPSSPYRVSYNGGEWVMSLARVDSGTTKYLYAGVRFDPVHILDVTDPDNPVVAGYFGGGGSTHGNFIVRGNHLYSTSGTDMFVYDVTNPLLPTTVSGWTCFSGCVYDVDVNQAGTIAYLNIHDNGSHYIQALDVSNPASLAPLTTYTTSSWTNDMAGYGSYLYITDSQTGLIIVDASNVNAATPSLTHVKTLPVADVGPASAVAFSGNYAYVAASSQGVKIVDISAPASAAVTSTIPAHSGYDVYDVYVQGSRLYVRANTGLEVYDISTPSAPVLVGDYNPDSSPISYLEDGDRLWVGSYLELNSIHMPEPVLSQFSSSSAVTDYDAYGVHGNHLFTTYANNFRVYDLSNPSAIVETGALTSEKFGLYLNGMDIADGYAYVTDGLNGLHVIDLVNPDSPVLVSTLPLAEWPTSIVVHNGFAYVTEVAAASYVSVIDVRNPASPVKVTSIPVEPQAASLAASGNQLYVMQSTTNNYFRVYDVSVPSAPVELGQLLLDGNKGNMIPDGNLVYLSNDQQGLRAIDVSTPATPVVANTVMMGPFSYGAARRSVLNGGNMTFPWSYSTVTVDMSDPLASTPSVAGFQSDSFWKSLVPLDTFGRHNIYGTKPSSGSPEIKLGESRLAMAARNTTALVGGTLSYSLDWDAGNSSLSNRAKCFVTGGTCTVTAIDNVANTASVSWTLPVISGDYEVLVTVGNYNYFASFKDRVTVN